MPYSALHHHKAEGSHPPGIRYSVYLPPEYEKGNKRYNILYLLHGVGDDEYGWPCKGWVQQILDELAWESSIVVMPLGFVNREEMEEKYSPAREPFEAYWFDEIVPSIKKISHP